VPVAVLYRFGLLALWGFKNVLSRQTLLPTGALED
jgi:hypothetical protein